MSRIWRRSCRVERMWCAHCCARLLKMRCMMSLKSHVASITDVRCHNVRISIPALWERLLSMLTVTASDNQPPLIVDRNATSQRHKVHVVSH
jgi:hypothetical protein